MSSEGDGTPADGALTSSNNNEDNEDSNSKRPHASTSNKDYGNPKRQKHNEKEPTPPNGDRTFGSYFQDKWIKDEITDEEKDFLESLLTLKINTLRKLSDIRQAIQNSLNIKLEHFLRHGKVIPADAVVQPYAVARVAAIDYDIRGSKMIYTRDLIAFTERVKGLFNWRKTESERREYMAPYFPLIQSSGTGKTKLMYEYKNSTFASDNDCHVELILCQDGKYTQLETSDPIFSKTLDIGEIGMTVKGREELWRRLNEAVTKAHKMKKKKVVLLFDESQHLTRKEDGWHFRSIRWWLRQTNSDVNVVCVFAGTTTKLANFYQEPKQSLTSRDVMIEYYDGTKLYPPFYQITTTGLVSITNGSDFGCADKEGVTEFDVASQYGRVLIGRMQLQQKLQAALGNILLRMRGSGQRLPLKKCYSLLATRLQMGQVAFDFASELVSAGYAHLTHFSPENSAVADIAFLPDPVCAWLAMTQMIEGCRRFEKVVEFTGQRASVWSENAIKIYSSGLCRPEKGDVGEVASAFYMLACGDDLRYEQNKNLTQLSVPLDRWIGKLQAKKENDDEGTSNNAKEGNNQYHASISFIQVCRNYLRHSLKEIQDSGLLKHWYLGGRASYAYASCPAYDIVVPVRYTLNNSFQYCPMLVSVKNRTKYSDSQRAAAMTAMESVFREAGIETGVCLLFLIGLESPKNSEEKSSTGKKSLEGNPIQSLCFTPDTLYSV